MKNALFALFLVLFTISACDMPSQDGGLIAPPTTPAASTQTPATGEDNGSSVNINNPFEFSSMKCFVFKGLTGNSIHVGNCDGTNGLLDVVTTSSTAISGSTSAVGEFGLRGISLATSGTGGGVSGISASPWGSGIHGINTATIGAPVGVHGVSNNANQGIGVLGESTFGGGAIGVMGKVYSLVSNVGWGMYGVASSGNPATGSGIGVVGATQDNSGDGVKGIATTTTGVNSGVHGTTASPDGYGVFGENPQGGYGVFTPNKAYIGGDIVAPFSALGSEETVQCAVGVSCRCLPPMVLVGQKQVRLDSGEIVMGEIYCSRVFRDK